MDRHELANLLSQTHPSIRADSARMSTSRWCNPPSPLSPRQQFQTHVRTLSDTSTTSPKEASSSGWTSGLRNVSSRRVQHKGTPSPRGGRLPSYRYSESNLKNPRRIEDEPEFVVEEREAWSRPSPLSTRYRRDNSGEAYILQPPEDESPARQPSKSSRDLRPFSPSLEHTDINERPKTGRGGQPGVGAFSVPPKDHSSGRLRSSKFEEGSMNNRSTGVSSSWSEHSTITSPSMFESDNEATPRPSTQRSSIDIEEFNPPAVTPATLKQRLVKFGTAFKHSNNNSNTENIGKAEADTQNARKKKGLRKSMSMWNIGGKKKSLNDSSHESMPKAVLPSKLSVTPIPKQDIEVLDGRKRKAEELYAQQFGMKKRKSVAGLHNSATEDEAEEMPSPKRHQPESQRGRRKSLPSSRQVGRSSSTTMNASDIPASQSDAESHKRPSRRELEKENQQLRELLRQQQQRQAQRQTSAHHGKESSSPAGGRPLPVPPEKSKPAADENCKPSVKKQTQTAQSNDIPPVPPVPSIPERAALRTLATGSSPSNSVANVIANNNASTKTNTNQATDTASPKRIVVGAGFPRPISMILEVDEEEGMEGKISSRSRIADEIQKLKEPSPSPLRMNGTKREQWEWPEDVF